MELELPQVVLEPMAMPAISSSLASEEEEDARYPPSEASIAMASGLAPGGLDFFTCPLATLRDDGADAEDARGE